jgi:hypothetical protein
LEEEFKTKLLNGIIQNITAVRGYMYNFDSRIHGKIDIDYIVKRIDYSLALLIRLDEELDKLKQFLGG